MIPYHYSPLIISNSKIPPSFSLYQPVNPVCYIFCPFFHMKEPEMSKGTPHREIQKFQLRERKKLAPRSRFLPSRAPLASDFPAASYVLPRTAVLGASQAHPLQASSGACQRCEAGRGLWA
jgi:hypothetical protein